MIILSDKEDQFKPSTPDPHFDVTAPNSNPLVASLPAVVTKTESAFEVSWDQESGPEEPANAGSVLQQISDQAKRDTLRFPGSARAHANFGAALAKAARVDEAVYELEIALSIEPNDYLAGVTLARVYVNNGNYDKARQLYEDLLRYHPKNDSILLSLAYLSLRSGNYAAAEEHLRTVLKLKKSDAFPHFLLGITRLQIGNLHGAVSALKEAARIDYHRAEFHHALGVAYVMVGDLGRAERAFCTAFSLSPNTPGPVHALSNVLIKQGQPVSALEYIRPYVESHPNDIEARDILANAYFDTGQYAHARAHLQAAVQIGGEKLACHVRSRLLTNIAATHLLEGKIGPAEGELNRAIELAPRSLSIPYEYLARIRVRAEEWDSAKEILENATRLFPDQQSLRRLLAGVHALLDSYDLAIADLRPLYDQGIAEPETYSALGSLYEWTGDYDSALRVLTEAYSRSPKSLPIINNLAYTHLMAGQVDAARSVLKSLPRSSKPHAELIATQGLLRIWEGDRTQGRLLYERAEQMASSSGNRDLARRVRQKKYLELAKDSVRRGDLVGGRLEIERGLSIRVEASSFKAKLEELLRKL
jgi:Flp pilus assembly protein TadD